MREELKGPEVKKIGVAVVQEQNELGEEIYNVYLINFYKNTLEGVLVSSKGYGVHHQTEEVIRTSMLRHHLDTMEPNSYKLIEPIIKDVFGLNNEYWVSFWIDRVMHDKKFIFLPETIKTENFVLVPVIEKMGVMIR
jgi:hypothetical protein